MTHGNRRRTWPVELGDVAHNRRRKIDLTAFDEEHQCGGRRNNFCKRREIPKRAVDTDTGTGCTPREAAVALREQNGIAASHDERCGGVHAASDPTDHGGVERNRIDECSRRYVVPGATPRG